jgi:hypothetical protein
LCKVWGHKLDYFLSYAWRKLKNSQSSENVIKGKQKSVLNIFLRISGYRRRLSLRNSTGDHAKVETALGERCVILVEMCFWKFQKIWWNLWARFLAKWGRFKQFWGENRNSREEVKLSFGENHMPVSLCVLEIFEFKLCGKKVCVCMCVRVGGIFQNTGHMRLIWRFKW